MKRTFLLPFLLLFALSACALGPETLSPIEDIAVQTDEEQVLRLAALTVWAGETATDRVLHFEPTDAPVVLQMLEVFKAKMFVMDKADSTWMYTSMYEMRRVVVLAAAKRVQGRVATILLSRPLSLDTVRRALDLTGKSAAMFKDIERLFEGLHDGDVTMEQAWTALRSRMSRNIDRLRPFVEGIWAS